MSAEAPSVAIIGLGLIGGSLARDLARAGTRVLGYDADAATLDAARRANVVHDTLGPSWSGLSGAAVVITAVPGDATADVLRAARDHLPRGALVMDVGSTKRSVLAAAESCGIAEQFVGAHPMAGDHRAGWDACRSGLFSDAIVYLCPTPRTAPAAVGRARDLWTSVGARPRLIDAPAHDALVASSSHLPHLASAALALAMPDAVTGEALGPGGRGVLRLAAASPELWTAIVMDNADALGPALAAFREQVERLCLAVGRGERAAVLEFLAAARGRAERLLPPGAPPFVTPP